jgi:hypothetical protein
MWTRSAARKVRRAGKPCSSKGDDRKQVKLGWVMIASMANPLMSWPTSVGAKGGGRPNTLDRKELVYHQGWSCISPVLVRSYNLSWPLSDEPCSETTGFPGESRKAAREGGGGRERKNSIRPLIIPWPESLLRRIARPEGVKQDTSGGRVSQNLHPAAKPDVPSLTCATINRPGNPCGTTRTSRQSPRRV